MATQMRSPFFLALFLFAATLVPSQPAPAQQFREKAKLVGAGFQQLPQQGTSVAVSADGNTAMVGGPLDNGDMGAAWVFTITNAGWTQQGDKLVAGNAVGNAEQGFSVALSSDGNTAIVGGPFDDGGTGAAWVYTRSSGLWTPQGKLVGNGGASAQQGTAVALSSDGNTAIVGGPLDNGGAGAAWVFTRSNGVLDPARRQAGRHLSEWKCRARLLRRVVLRRVHRSRRWNCRQRERRSNVGFCPQQHWSCVDAARQQTGRHRCGWKRSTRERRRIVRQWQHRLCWRI